MVEREVAVSPASPQTYFWLLNPITDIGNIRRKRLFNHSLSK